MTLSFPFFVIVIFILVVSNADAMIVLSFDYCCVIDHFLMRLLLVHW